jgi:hypothetical protein
MWGKKQQLFLLFDTVIHLIITFLYSNTPYHYIFTFYLGDISHIKMAIPINCNVQLRHINKLINQSIKNK